MWSRSNGSPDGSPWPARRRRTRQDGFTLIEVLVAFAIASIGLTVLFQAFSVGLRTEEKVRAGWTALRLAQSKLASVGLVAAVRPGVTAGKAEQGFAWDVEVVPLPAATEADERLQRPLLARVTVRVRAYQGAAPMIELNSIRPVDEY